MAAGYTFMQQLRQQIVTLHFMSKSVKFYMELIYENHYEGPSVSASQINTITPTLASSVMDDMTKAKLWENPCGLAFRLNYLALRYNTPCYNWVHECYGLSRIEYVVIYSLALCPGGQARDIACSSGFPKNSLSRAIAKLEQDRYIKRKQDREDKRKQSLFLSAKGQKLFDRTLPAFEHRENQLLESLSADEQNLLSALMAKMVGHCNSIPDELPDHFQ